MPRLDLRAVVNFDETAILSCSHTRHPTWILQVTHDLARRHPSLTASLSSASLSSRSTHLRGRSMPSVINASNSTHT